MISTVVSHLTRPVELSANICFASKVVELSVNEPEWTNFQKSLKISLKMCLIFAFPHLSDSFRCDFYWSSYVVELSHEIFEFFKTQNSGFKICSNPPVGIWDSWDSLTKPCWDLGFGIPDSHWDLGFWDSHWDLGFVSRYKSLRTKHGTFSKNS